MPGQKGDAPSLWGCPWFLSPVALCWQCCVLKVYHPVTQDPAFLWKGPLTTKQELREKLAYMVPASMFWGFLGGFSFNYEESAGSSYTQAKKKPWKPDLMNQVWPDEVYLGAW